MTEDIIKQAEMRQQRRPKSTSRADQALFNDSCEVDKGEKPTPNQPDERQYLAPGCNISGRPRSSRRRTTSYNYAEDDSLIRADVMDREFKALINTATCYNKISKRVHELLSTSSHSSASSMDIIVCIEGHSYQACFQFADDEAADIVIGTEFLTKQNCTVDFDKRMLTAKDGMKAPFLTENSVPLQYRERIVLTASI